MPTDSLTDLIGGLILIPMLFILWPMKEAPGERRRWLALFGLLAASCLTGCVAHYYFEPRSKFAFDLVWIGLYPLLYATVAAFFLLARHIRAPGRPVPYWFYVPALLGAVISTVILWTVENTDWDIRLFVLFAAVVGVLSFIFIAPAAFRQRDPGAARIFWALVPLLGAVYFQVERKTTVTLIWEFNYNAIAHVFIILAELIFFAAAVKRLHTGKKDSKSN